MADNMIIPTEGYIAMHKFYIAVAKSCRIRLVEPEKSGQAAAFLRARLADAGVPRYFGLRPANAELAVACSAPPEVDATAGECHRGLRRLRFFPNCVCRSHHVHQDRADLLPSARFETAVGIHPAVDHPTIDGAQE